MSFYGISAYKFVLLILFLVVLAVFGIAYGPKILDLVKEPHVFSEFIEQHGHWGATVFLGVQVLQILVPPIPGEVVQLAGGYIFGPLWGTVYLLLGAALGSTIAFYIARFLGYPFVEALVSETRMEKLGKLFKTPKLDLAIFIAFLIPGFPKDLLTYLAGLTRLPFARFLLLALAGRFPALFVSVALGSNLREKAYGQVALAAAAAGVILLISIRYRKQILSRLKPEEETPPS